MSTDHFHSEKADFVLEWMEICIRERKGEEEERRRRDAMGFGGRVGEKMGRVLVWVGVRKKVWDRRDLVWDGGA